MTAGHPLLEVRSLSVHFRVSHRLLRAVDGVDLVAAEGQTLGIVGESGSGKSTLARAVVGLEQVTAGSVLFRGQDLPRLRGRRLRQVRRDIQMVFQDPRSSLNSRHRVETIVSEPLVVHRIGTPAQRREQVDDLLRRVGLDPAVRGRYPHQLSGGQQQRVAIARAISLNPSLLLCDEAVSALDVSIQAQVTNLLRNLQRTLGLTMVFIAHDLALVRYISDRIAVFYLGRVVEERDSEDLFARPLHPYTQALVDAVPVPDARVERGRRRVLLPGEIPSPTDVPSGCRFRTRCRWAQERCAVEVPELREVAGYSGRVACHFAETVVASDRAALFVPGSAQRSATR